MKTQWNPKVRKEKIWELYQKEAMGVADAKLIDDVGIGLFLRCESILMVSNREVFCPQCGTRFQLKKTWHDKAESFRCPSANCSWRIGWKEYHNSWRHRDLMGGNAIPAFRDFLDAYPSAENERSKMILIDKLIHSFHMHAKSQLPTKPASCNLIEGKMKNVVEMLDGLSCPDGIDKAQWKRSIETGRRIRMGKTW